MTKALGDTPYERVKRLMEILRSPDGCPWDREQSFATIAPYTIEEAYEVADAIARNDMDDLREELGDFLFQVVFHARIAEEAGHFNLDDVVNDLVEKMVRRHPHVFGSGDERSADDQTLAWDAMKAAERAAKEQEDLSVLSGIALALPALMRAEKLQKRAAKVGFDWPDIDGVIEKITEEAQELSEAALSKNRDAIEDEMGDLLFAVTNLSRRLDIDPEAALRRTNNKFTRRFQHIETTVEAEGRDISDMDLDEMERYWQAAKTLNANE